MTSDPTFDLTPNSTYRIRYRPAFARSDREAVMVYLGVEAGDDLRPRSAWSALPYAGTQHLPVSWLVSVEEVPPTTEAYMNRRPAPRVVEGHTTGVNPIGVAFVAHCTCSWVGDVRSVKRTASSDARAHVDGLAS